VNRPRLLVAATFGLWLGVIGAADAGEIEAEPAAEAPPPAAEAPLVEPTATVWAQAGSRSWTGCSKIASEAAKQLFTGDEATNNLRDNHHWAIQARECPGVPDVLAMAARSELLRRLELPEGVDETTDLSALELASVESRARANAWIDGATTELRRRRDKRNLGLEYWRGRAHLSLNEIEQAKLSLGRAIDDGTTEGWKIRRLLALAALYAGDLEAGLVLANRAMIDAPHHDRLVSAYVLALVLDRAGDSAGAERRMKHTLDMDGDGSQMRALEASVPIHERLYLRAYAKTVRRETSGALRLWDAYLARSEPEDPERRLAERHRIALQPLPTNLGGPAHADEGRDASGR